MRNRQPIFADQDLASAVVEVLHTHSSKQGVPVYGYCVMPDHVHLVLGPSQRCDIVTFVGQFKNLVLRAAWARGVQGSFWQSSFWDHLVRVDRGLREAVEYVLANPVRRGLAKDRQDYPFAGSLVWERAIGNAAGDEPPRYRLLTHRTDAVQPTTVRGAPLIPRDDQIAGVSGPRAAPAQCQ